MLILYFMMGCIIVSSLVYLIYNEIILKKWIFNLRQRKGSITEVPSHLKFSIIVPCRNEAHNIISLLESIYHQIDKSFELIVIDDHSTDNTLEIITQFQSVVTKRFPGIDFRIIRADDRDSSWSGKSYACFQASTLAKTDYLLFLDADVVLDPLLISNLKSYISRKKVKALSSIGRIDHSGFWEKLFNPFIFLFISLIHPLTLVNWRKSKSHLAIGSFIAIERALYNQIGGHQKIKSYLGEDIALSKAVKTAGERYHFVYASGLYRLKMYPDSMSMNHNWPRLLAVAYEKGLGKMMIPLALLLTLILVAPPISGLITSFIYLLSPQDILIKLMVSFFLFSSLFFLLDFSYRLIHKENLWYSFLFPLSGALLVSYALKSWYRISFKKGVIWKDRAFTLK